MIYVIVKETREISSPLKPATQKFCYLRYLPRNKIHSNVCCLTTVTDSILCNQTKMTRVLKTKVKWSESHIYFTQTTKFGWLKLKAFADNKINVT